MGKHLLEKKKLYVHMHIVKNIYLMILGNENRSETDPGRHIALKNIFKCRFPFSRPHNI